MHFVSLIRDHFIARVVVLGKNRLRWQRQAHCHDSRPKCKKAPAFHVRKPGKCFRRKSSIALGKLYCAVAPTKLDLDPTAPNQSNSNAVDGREPSLALN